MATHFVGLPSGRVVNLDQVVGVGGLKWERGLHQEPIPTLSLIVPGGGADSAVGYGTMPAEYVLHGDDALALWWHLRQIPALDVPEGARKAADNLRPKHMQPETEQSTTPIPPPLDDTLPDQPF